jgi:hypothetical protein
MSTPAVDARGDVMLAVLKPTRTGMVRTHPKDPEGAVYACVGNREQLAIIAGPVDCTDLVSLRLAARHTSRLSVILEQFRNALIGRRSVTQSTKEAP